MLSLEICGSIAVVTLLGDSKEARFPWGTLIREHRINPDLVASLNGALDAALADSSIGAVVVTGEGGFFSNGMDLQWIESHQDGADKLQWDTEQLLARLLTFPLPTLAAINGHFCAAGAMLGLAFDIRMMTSENKLFFVPGVDLGLVYSSGMTALMKSKTPFHMHVPMIVLGQRYSTEDLVREKIVSKSMDRHLLVENSVKFLQELTNNGRFTSTKYRETVHAIKKRTFHEAYTSLLESSPSDRMGFDKGVWDEHGTTKKSNL